MKRRKSFSHRNGISTGKLVWAVLGLWGVVGQSAPAEQSSRALVPVPAPAKHCALVVAVPTAPDAGESARLEGLCRTKDAHQLAEQLAQAGYGPEHILLMSPRAEKPNFHPLRKHLQTQIADLLARLNPQDGLLIYWTGQAYRSADGEQLWLAAADWDPAQPAETGISTAWLKKLLETCRAQWKLMILDTPSGQDKTAPLPRANGEQIAQALHGLPRLALLTSSRAEEPSLLWPAVEQSIFGFWLCQAFAGHADRNEDTRLSLEELADFLSENVGRTAQEEAKRNQSVYLYKPPAEQLPQTVASVSKVSLASVLEKFAEQIVQQAAKHQVARIAVAEFRPLLLDSSPKSSLSTLLDGGPGILGRWCAEQLENALRQALQKEPSLAGLQVVPYADFHAVLTRSQLSPSVLQGGGTRGLSGQIRTLEAVVLGNFLIRTGRRLSLECRLQHLSTGRPLAQFQLAAVLTDEELAMLGVSLDSPVAWQQPLAPGPGPISQPGSIGQHTQQHPYPDAQVPFRVMIYVDGQPKPSQLIGQKEYVFLPRGKIYKIIVENYLPEPVYLRLLVDGLNTLPEPVPRASPGSAQGGSVYLPARRVHLEKARAWRLEGREPNGPPKRYSIDGFYRRLESTSPGKALYEWETFKVVDPPQSWAAQQAYTEQIGMITAAFYAVSSGTRGGGIQPGGTAGGPTHKGELQEYQEVPVGPLLKVIHLYYAIPNDSSSVPPAKPMPPQPPASISGN